jgi:curved DNA-binding protein CbpA
MNIEQALKTLELATPFTLQELKAAYRQAVKRTHPDLGGSSAAFIQVDAAAYDFLRQRATDDKTELGSSRWADYYKECLPKWEKEFRQQWRKAYKKNLGLAYSTAIERFARAYIRQKREWFLGALFSKASLQEKEKYRAHLLAIAPNRQFAEAWALRYYRLEFGEDSPWIFYLSGSVVADREDERV